MDEHISDKHVILRWRFSSIKSDGSNLTLGGTRSGDKVWTDIVGKLPAFIGVNLQLICSTLLTQDIVNLALFNGNKEIVGENNKAGSTKLSNSTAS